MSRLPVLRAIRKEAAFAATSVIRIVLSTAAILVFTAEIDQEAEVASAGGLRMIGDAG